MKKNYLFLIISLLLTLGTFAQNVVRVYDFDVKMGHASDVARNFADYHNVERKSGAAILQSVSFLDGVTHRMILLVILQTGVQKLKNLMPNGKLI